MPLPLPNTPPPRALTHLYASFNRRMTALGCVTESKPILLKLTPLPESFQPAHGNDGSSASARLR